MYCYVMEGYIHKTARTPDPEKKVELRDQIGGLPFGIAEGKYPHCQQCNSPMTFIAQFLHDVKRLDLKKEGRVLYIFNCLKEDCDLWNPDSGASFCFVLEREMLTNKFTNVPDDCPLVEWHIYPNKWKRWGEGIPNKLAPDFLTFDKYIKISYDELEKVVANSKLNGVPAWIQNPEEKFSEGWKFVGQLNSKDTPFCYNLDEQIEFIWGYGMGYIFMKEAEGDEIPECKFFFQCT